MMNEKTFVFNSSFIIHHSSFLLAFPSNDFRLIIRSHARAENFMATQTVERTTTDATREIISYDPATGAEVGRVPVASAAEVAHAVERARAAQAAWGALEFRERGRVILRAREIVLAELEEIATLIAREAGKPIAEAIAMELVPTLDLMQHFARRTARLLRPEKIDIGQYGLMGRSSRVVYRPLGVVGIISPR